MTDCITNLLFCDLKTDEEKAAFFLSGRGYETGVIALSIQNDVAMAYHRCSEYSKVVEALQAEMEQLKSMTAMTMGVGSGDGNLFVHGDYESIKAAQTIVLERDALRGALEEAEEAMRFVYTSCATFPQEPKHIQNAAWRRVVNAVTKARATLAKEYK